MPHSRRFPNRLSAVRHARTVSGLLLLGALSLLTPAAQAQTQVLDFTGGQADFSLDNDTFGWEFALSTTVSVTDLGIFDEGNNGLLEAHQIGLWTTGGTLLASTTIPAGLSGTAVVSGSGFGAFRYVSIAPVVLTPGSYVVGAFYPSDTEPFRVDPTAISTTPGFSFTQGRFGDTGLGFMFPAGGTSGNDGFFGPNLRFTASAAAPEPGTIGLLALTGLPIATAVVRRRRSV